MSINNLYSCIIVDILEKDSNVKQLLEKIKTFHLGTYQHSKRVAINSINLGLKKGLNKEDIGILGLCALLHDVGKLNIPIEILTKNGKLDPEERKIIQKHPSFSKEILDKIEINKEIKTYILDVAENHHIFKKKPYTGHDGIYSDLIHITLNEKSLIFTQIVAAADICDALSSKRDYKEAMPKEKVREIMFDEYKGEVSYIEMVLESI